jgi:hypothetical protein
MAKPNKRDRFVHLANHRVSKALHFLDLLGNLADKEKYDFTKKDIDKIAKAIDRELEISMKRFSDRPITLTFNLTNKEEQE